jgi:hypothetical protein
MIIFMNVCCYNRCHGNAVKGFWALWDNIYDYVCLLTLDFPIILDGKITSVCVLQFVVQIPPISPVRCGAPSTYHHLIRFGN